MLNPLKIGLLSVCLTTGAMAPAFATSISISNVGITDFETVNLAGGALGSGTMSGLSGQIDLTTSIGNLGVWCVDLFHEIFLGGQYTATPAPLVTNNSNPPASLSAGQINQIAALAAFGNAFLQPTANRTFDSATLGAFSADMTHFQSAAHSDFSTLTANGLNAFSAAVQSAIWQVEYGVTATNPSDANFATDLNIILADATPFFDNVGGFQLDITDSQGNQVQRQFVSQVPEPGTLALFFAGLLGLYAFRRKGLGRQLQA